MLIKIKIIEWLCSRLLVGFQVVLHNNINGEDARGVGGGIYLQ